MEVVNKIYLRVSFGGAMKKKNPIFVYAYIWLTAGFYFYYWLFAQMKTINELREMQVFHIKQRVLFLMGIIVLTDLYALLTLSFSIIELNNQTWSLFILILLIY
jgi:hypothetical protein